MTTALPAPLQTGRITGHVSAIIADTTADPDTDPDLVAVPGLKATFKPTPARLLAPSIKRSLLPQTIVADFDEQGVLRHNGQPYLDLIATDVDAVSPVDWTWTVTITAPSIPPWTFDFELPAGETKDLSELAPASSTNGTPILRGPSPYEDWLAHGNTGTFEDFLATIEGATPTLVGGTTTTLAPGEAAEVTLVPLGDATYRVDAAVPGGAPGGSDAATAEWIELGTLTPAAIAASPPVANKVAKGEIVVNVRDYGAVGGAELGGAGVDDGAAIEAAILAAHNASAPPGVARRVFFPGGFYRSNRDLAITASNVVLSGEGPGSGLILAGANLRIDGTNALIQGNMIRDMRVRRLGTPVGDALAIIGGSAGGNKFPARWALSDVTLESVGGTALRMKGTFLGTCTDIYLRGSHTGLVIEKDPSGSLGANAISFHGGEIQGVTQIGTVSGGLGISFHGMAWEGSAYGMDVNDTSGFTVVGPYWEANGEYDLRVGEAAVCAGVAVKGGFASTGALGAKPRSIVLRRSAGTSVTGVRFSGYGSSPVLVNEVSANLVTGSASANSNSSPATPVVEILAGTNWDDQLINGTVTVGSDTAARGIRMNGPAGTQRAVFYRTAGASRWNFGTDAVAETGADAGTNFQLIAYGDNGAFLGQALTAYRANRLLRAHADMRIDGSLDHNGSSVGFYGVAPVARQTLSATPTTEEIAAVLKNLGLAQ